MSRWKSKTKQQDLTSFFIKIANFFCNRPFSREKKQETIIIKFHRVTTYDLKYNFVLLFMMMIFQLFIIAILINIILLIVDSDWRNNIGSIESGNFVLMPLPMLLFQFLVISTVILIFWDFYFKMIFTERIIKFDRYEITIFNKIFGSQHKILAIPKLELPVLREKQENTTVPQVKNTSLRISYKHKNVELAGHLLPEAMNIVQTTYDRYRNLEFNNFYFQTENIFLE